MEETWDMCHMGVNDGWCLEIFERCSKNMFLIDEKLKP